MTEEQSNTGTPHRSAQQAPMSREQVAALVLDTMAELFQLERSQLTLQADLRRDLGLDSIDAVDMAAKLQQLTGSRVALAELTALQTIADVVDLAGRHLARPAASTRSDGSG
jgi:acyl carrier protein